MNPLWISVPVMACPYAQNVNKEAYIWKNCTQKYVAEMGASEHVASNLISSTSSDHN